VTPDAAGPISSSAVTARDLSLDEAIALAKRAPLARKAVADLGRKMTPATAREAAERALASAGGPPALVLAFVAAAGGEKLELELTRALIHEVLVLDHVGPLVFATKGDPLDVCARFLDGARGDPELECIVMLLAAIRFKERQASEPDLAIPRVLLVRGRWLARHQLTSESAICLGQAVLLLDDPALASLAAPHVNRAKRGKKTLEEVLEAAHRSPLEALDDADGQRLSSGFTVRHETPSVGRNDPCPCGSGKKYKKCCANAPDAGGAPTISAEPRLDPALLGVDQVGLLGPREIAALETSRLSRETFEEAFVRMCVVREWPLVLRMLDEAKARDPSSATSLCFLALGYAREARDLAAAETLYARLPPDVADRQRFALECLRAPPDLLAQMEREALAALEGDADGGAGIRFASTLLEFFPALGIYVARGAVHERFPNDSQDLLEQAEDARDRLLLSPYEAFWDVFEWLAERGTDSLRDDLRVKKKEKEDAKRAKLKEDLRLARAASRKTAVELEKLQRRVTELDDALTTAPASARAKPTGPRPEPSPELTEERRRLKTKIDELERIIGEGQEERRELRQKLASRERETGDDEERGPSSFGAIAPQSTRNADPDAEPEGLHEPGAVDLPRAVLVPRFADRAAKAVSELASDPADAVLSVVAALAAGKPNAWSGVKQLTRIRGVLSARAGIHHRVLFAVADRHLEVLEVLHRKDLEQVVARLARAS
jgi:hypothetical protein